MGLFDKKYCDICGEKIGLLGNRKLEDGNLCKDCARKLSPFFSERRSSTVEDIKRQLAYRAENEKKLAGFAPSITFDGSKKVYIDPTIDLGGYSGTVRHNARVLSGMLPIAREQLPLVQEKNLYIDTIDANKEYDVFISHASEDKDSVVRPLALALKEKGVNVWYDEFELKIGDSLRRKIDQGLSKSKFGIVVISRSFIKKGWTNYELDGLMTKAISGQQILLPIWHDITKQEVIDYSPSLADKVARNTSQETVEEIASEVAELIHSSI